MPAQQLDLPRTGSVAVAGVVVDAHTEESLTEAVLDWANGADVHVAVGVNAHVCNLAKRDRELHEFLSRSETYADGQSVVWAARLLGGYLPERLATTDIAWPVLRAAASAELPVYFLGADEGIARTAADRLRSQIPGLRIRTHHGYFSDDESAPVIADIRDHGTRILFVGMGDPRQQRWVQQHLGDLPPAVLTCGGLFDWLSGSNRRAPKWMIGAGLEWLWRLMLEPRRLARRYLLGNPAFIAAILRQRIAPRLGG